MRRVPLLVLLLGIGSVARAQSSASYRLEEQALNAGGQPVNAVVSTSLGYRLALDSIGDALTSRELSSPSYRLTAGFAGRYPPPGEIGGLEILHDGQTLAWSWEHASTAFNVYRGALSTLPGGYGDCALARVAGTSWTDPFVPTPGAGSFYLVTGENLLWQEGTKGFASSGAERANPSPCP